MYFNYFHNQHNQSLFKYRYIWSRNIISECQCKIKTSCVIAKWNQLVSFLAFWIFLAHTLVIECKHKQTLTVYFTTGSKTYLKCHFLQIISDIFWYCTVIVENCWYLLLILLLLLIIADGSDIYWCFCSEFW